MVKSNRFYSPLVSPSLRGGTSALSLPQNLACVASILYQWSHMPERMHSGSVGCVAGMLLASAV
jgi:hypothetical protein